MAFDRVFKIYNSAGALQGTLDNKIVEHAEFELLRQGGCGAGSLRLAESFDTDTLEVGDNVQFCLDSSTPVYMGRVEEVTKTVPSGTEVRLFGWVSYLNDLALGGRGKGDADDPLLYAGDDFFPSDPDADEQVRVDTSSIKTAIEDIYTNSIAPNTPITLSSIETSTDNDFLKSMVFRGEENVSQVIRQMAVSAGWMSWGVEENGLFFVVNLPIASTHSYQIGVDVENLSESTDRSLMYNRIIFTGGPVYGMSTQHGFAPYKENVVHYPSRTTYGEKKISLTIPWIRTNDDCQAFCERFFQEYAGLSVRYTFDVSGELTIPKPWLSRVLLLDADGNTLKNAVPTVVRVQFNETPVVSLTLGPEDLQFPSDPHPKRDPGFNPTDLGDGTEFNCAGLVAPLAPTSGWGETWECESTGPFVFGVTTEEISAGTCVIGPPAITACREIVYNDSTGEMELVCRSFDMYTFDPSLDGTPVGTPVMARRVKDKYWGVWVGCEGGGSGCEEDGVEVCEESSSSLSGA